MAFNARKIFSVLSRVVREISRVQAASKKRAGSPARGGVTGSVRTDRAPGFPQQSQGQYPGDYSGAVSFEYSPNLDGEPDPGEVVWGWVPYEEDHSQGKDRPVLLVGRDRQWLLALMLTSKDNTNGRHQDHDYLDIGTGAWDRQGRPSEVKLDRVIRLSPDAIRREGAVLDRERFQNVARHFNAR